MPESAGRRDEDLQAAPSGPLDWEKLAASLGASSAEEAQKRAYEIAEFVAKIENDKDSELILKTGGKKLSLTLNK